MREHAGNKHTTKQLGLIAGKQLLERLNRSGMLDGLHQRIVATIPTVGRKSHPTNRLSSMFQATARRDAICYACARLAFNASTIFAEKPWHEFIAGIEESAVNNTNLDQPYYEMRRLETRTDIAEYININDHRKSLAHFCGHYPPEAEQVLIDISNCIEPIVSEILGGIKTERATTIPSLIKFIVLFSLCLGATFLIGLSYQVFLVTSLVVGYVAFRIGKSTKVPANPREVPLSPMVTLSYRAFDKWAQQNDLRRTDESFFSRDDVHWTEKIPVLLMGSNASGHCFEPSRSTKKLLFVCLSLGAFIFIPSIQEAFSSLDFRGSLLFQLLCGLALGQFAGRATGAFYRWFRAKI